MKTAKQILESLRKINEAKMFDDKKKYLEMLRKNLGPDADLIDKHRSFVDKSFDMDVNISELAASLKKKKNEPKNEEDEGGKKTFLAPKIVMVDLEMSGVVPERDDVLQVAMLKLVLKFQDGIPQYDMLGDPLNIFIKSDKQPSNGFHTKYLTDIFAQANKSNINAEAGKQLIHDWLGDWKGIAIPAGDAVNNDLGFLYAKGLIERGDIVDDKPVPGTFHYEIYDANFPKDIARTITGEREALDLEDGIHNALVDCRNQTKELNHFLKTIFSLGKISESVNWSESKIISEVTKLFHSKKYVKEELEIKVMRGGSVRLSYDDNWHGDYDDLKNLKLGAATIGDEFEVIARNSKGYIAATVEVTLTSAGFTFKFDQEQSPE